MITSIWHKNERVDENVVAVDFPMDDVVEMQILEAGENLTGVVGDQLDVFVERTKLLAQQPRQRLAGNPFRDHL